MISVEERLSRLEGSDVLTQRELRRHRFAIRILTALVVGSIGIFMVVAVKRLTELES